MIKARLALILLALTPACGSKDEAPATPAAKPTGDRPRLLFEADKDAIPAYTADGAAKLVADLGACEYDFNCAAYKPLVSYGTKVSADLAKIATDATKPGKARQVAAKALGEIKDPATGNALFDAAKAEKDFIIRGDLYAAAGHFTGSDDVFKAAGPFFVTDDGWETRGEVEKALVPFGHRTFDWATVELAKHFQGKKYDKLEEELAALAVKVSTPADAPKLKELAGKVKAGDLAQCNLATALVQYGDASQLDVLVKALGGDDEFVRSAAGMHVADLAEKKLIPADQKDKLIPLLTAAKAKDAGGMTSDGYDRALKVFAKS